MWVLCRLIQIQSFANLELDTPTSLKANKFHKYRFTFFDCNAV